MTNTDEKIRLKPGHYYRFNDRGTIHIGQYYGREAEFECIVCGFGHNCRCFNLWHDKRGDYETWGFGSAHFPEILEDLGEPDEPILDP
jgi:hypothetical protein